MAGKRKKRAKKSPAPPPASQPTAAASSAAVASAAGRPPRGRAGAGKGEGTGSPVRCSGGAVQASLPAAAAGPVPGAAAAASRTGASPPPGAEGGGGCSGGGGPRRPAKSEGAKSDQFRRLDRRLRVRILSYLDGDAMAEASAASRAFRDDGYDFTLAQDRVAHLVLPAHWFFGGGVVAVSGIRRSSSGSGSGSGSGRDEDDERGPGAARLRRALARLARRLGSDPVRRRRFRRLVVRSSGYLFVSAAGGRETEDPDRRGDGSDEDEGEGAGQDRADGGNVVPGICEVEVITPGLGDAGPLVSALYALFPRARRFSVSASSDLQAWR